MIQQTHLFIVLSLKVFETTKSIIMIAERFIIQIPNACHVPRYRMVPNDTSVCCNVATYQLLLPCFARNQPTVPGCFATEALWNQLFPDALVQIKIPPAANHYVYRAIIFIFRFIDIQSEVQSTCYFTIELVLQPQQPALSCNGKICQHHLFPSFWLSQFWGEANQIEAYD